MQSPAPIWLRPAAPRTLGLLAIVFGGSVAALSSLTVVTGGRIGDPDQYPEAALDAFTAATRIPTLCTSLVMLLMSVMLVFIGGGLRRYEAWARRASLRWSAAALVIVLALTYVNVAVIGPETAALVAAAKEPELEEFGRLMRWAGWLTALVYAPFPIILGLAVRRPDNARALDQPRRVPR